MVTVWIVKLYVFGLISALLILLILTVWDVCWHWALAGDEKLLLTRQLLATDRAS